MKRNVFFSVAVAAMSFFFIACGGEDCTGSECDDQTDTIVITDNDQIADDATSPDEDMVDNELPDNDSTPLTCEQDPTCKQKCEPVLETAGNWRAVEPNGVTGTIAITLFYDGSDCNIAVSGMWTFTWKLQQLTCLAVPEYSSYFSLLEMEGEKLVINKLATKEGCEAGELTTVKFEKIQ